MNDCQFTIARIFLLLTIGASSTADAHKGESHSGESPKKPSAEAVVKNSALPAQITNTYADEIAPVFRRSCFDCHSSETNYPWYAKLPFAKDLIANDIAEAKKHLDMTDGFPFKGHGSVIEDMEAIETAVREETMPPLRYQIMHWNARLTDEDREKVLRWTGQTLNHLRRMSEEQN